jgi:malonate decarboxylase gamma subunit
MTLVEILSSLFPQGHDVTVDFGLVSGHGKCGDGISIAVIGIDGRTAVGVDEAAWLAARVLNVVERGGKTPILVLVDSDSQRMSKRDEMLGLNEFLAHLAKCLIYADAHDHPTIGLLYGYTAAGAFIATALSTRVLLALPGAEPAVMDLPSMARVTKLPLEVLLEKARSTPVFAPGLENLAQTGAVALVLNPEQPLSAQLDKLLQCLSKGQTPRADLRAQMGKARLGRPKAADIAERVHALVLASV